MLTTGTLDMAGLQAAAGAARLGTSCHAAAGMNANTTWSIAVYAKPATSSVFDTHRPTRRLGKLSP